MTTDPIKDFFDEAAPQRINPSAARAEFAAMAPAFRIARRRHRIRMAAASAMFAFGLTAAGTAVLATIAVAPTDPISEPAGPPDTVSDISDTAPESDATDDHDDLDNGDDPSGDTNDPGSSTTESPAAAAADDPTDPIDSSPDSGDDEDDEDDESFLVDETEPALDGSKYRRDSLGGSVTVELVDGALHLVLVDEADGFTGVVDKEKPDEIKVRFRGNDMEYRIEFKLVDELVEIGVSTDGDSDD